MNPRPTLADVAAVAGVSTKTVSNVMLGRPRAGAATRERVLASAAALGYSPNRAGRGLASGRTGRITAVVPNLHQPYYAEVAEQLITTLEQSGLQTVLRIADSERNELQAVAGGRNADVEGVVVCPRFHDADQLRAANPQRPMIQLGGNPGSGLDCVLMGERAGALAATRHLLQAGRSRLALLWNHPSPQGQERYEGVAQAMAEHSLRPDPRLFACASDWDRPESGYEAMMTLLSSGARLDAVVCVNDATAVGALRALVERNRRVPDDVAVTGFDDTEDCAYTSPPLTTVSPRTGEMVTVAVDLLLARLGGSREPVRHVRAGADLVPRQSSAR